MKTRVLSKNNKIREEVTPKSKGLIIFTLLCIVIFYPPFFKGLFFEKEILMTHIISFLLFSIYLANKLLNGEKLKIDSPFDIIGVLLIIAYILPIATLKWANLRVAIGYVLRYINFFVIYLMIKDYVNEKKYKNIIIDVIICSGVVTATIGLLAIAGYVNYTDAVLTGNRISSTFQYPNTLAAFMMTLFFLSATMQSIEEKLWKKNLYAISGYIMLLTFIFTYSRAAWLLFPIFALLYFLVIRGEDRIKVLLYLITVGISNLVILQPFMSQTNSVIDKNIKSIATVLLGLVIFSLMYNGCNLIIKKLKDKQYKLIYGFVGILVAVSLAFTVVAINMTEPLVFDNTNVEENTTNSVLRSINNIVPNNEYVLKINVDGYSEAEGHWPWRIHLDSINEDGESFRLHEILGDDTNNGELNIPFATLEDTKRLNIRLTNMYPNTRVTFYDAFIYDNEDNIIEEIKLSYKYIPEALISRFNSININERSSSLRVAFYKDSFKIFRDYPIFGAGGGAWKSLYPMYQTQQYFTTEAHNYYSEILVETGTFGILVISSLILVILIILINSIKIKNNLNTTIVITILSLLAHSALDFNFSYLSIPIYLWVLIGLLANEDLKEFSFIKLNRNISTVIGLLVILPLTFLSFSFYGANKLEVSAIESLQSKDIEKGINKLEIAVVRDRFNVNLQNIYAEILMSLGSSNGQYFLFDKAEEGLLRATRFEPTNSKSLELLSRLYMQTGRFDEAIEYANKIMATEPMRTFGYEYMTTTFMSLGDYYLQEGDELKAFEMYNNTLTVIDDILETNERADAPIILSDSTLSNINKARYLVENKENPNLFSILNNTEFIAYFDIDLDNDGLTDSWRKWQSVDANLETKTSENGIFVSNNGTDLGLIHSQNFSLEPATNYVLEFILEGNLESNVIVARILSRNGTSTQLAERINNSSEDNIYRFAFRTKDDIEPGAQYLLFDHLGNSDEVFLFKKVIIYEPE
ncbi:O-antigen ligase family protein [Serpentinicella alkaliphila]|uniref:O-antigen ligase-like membrane protein n=1 Tax=Serpentinicella alkaliphila TaxID=1734049 RepID=A0A4R2T9N7_9FIRM|nr:O-antigen ligase family protein [Serpentinicella alkaliphila]QUH25051.1 O-antigen ligase family protein [Serpentinicella alkaliphila]TCP98416.1 O-antigen ligase-like membrane protein [Serpentinicella alkaliphila]